MLKSFLTFFLIVLVFVLQTSFFASLHFLGRINLILIGLVLLSIFNYPLALKWALISGLLLDINSIFPFGTFALILLTVAIGVNFLFKNFFTNKSFYSFAVLILAGILIYNSEILAFRYLFHWLKITDFYLPAEKTYFIDLFWQIAANLSFVYLAYLIFSRTKFAERHIR